MSRCNTIIAAALAAAALVAAPTALAEPADFHAGPEFAAPAPDLRSPDTRDAARPDTAGNPTVAAATDAALAQERYYASYDQPTPPPAVVTNAGDGIARLPFVLAVFGALVVGLGAGSGLHLLHARRRAPGLAT